MLLGSFVIIGDNSLHVSLNAGQRTTFLCLCADQTETLGFGLWRTWSVSSLPIQGTAESALGSERRKKKEVEVEEAEKQDDTVKLY